MVRRRLHLTIQPSQMAAFIWLLIACGLARSPRCSTDVDFCIEVSDHMFSISNFDPLPSTKHKMFWKSFCYALYTLACFVLDCSTEIQAFHRAILPTSLPVVSFRFDAFWYRLHYLLPYFYTLCDMINLLAPDLFLMLAHTVYKMWIIQEPNTLDLWNKLYF